LLNIKDSELVSKNDWIYGEVVSLPDKTNYTSGQYRKIIRNKISKEN